MACHINCGELSAALSVLLQPADGAEEDVIWREYQVERGTSPPPWPAAALKSSGVQHSFDVELTIDQILLELGQEVHAGDTALRFSRVILGKYNSHQRGGPEAPLPLQGLI